MTRLIDAIIRDVAELPDRNSPDDFPEAMLVTGDELREIIQRNLITNAPTVQREVSATKTFEEEFNKDGFRHIYSDEEKNIAKSYFIRGYNFVPTVHREGWVSVEDRLPDDGKCVLAIVLDKDNAKGWHWQIVNYGHYDFYTFDDDHPNADEEGLVSRTGWYYGRESEDEFDYLIFELDGKVTHWQPLTLPAAPTDAE